MDSNVPAPSPLMIRVDLNRDPSPTPHEFFFPDYPDHYPPSRYSAPSPATSHEEISDSTLFPRPRQPHQGNDHPDHANSVEKLLIAQGGLFHHPLYEDVIKGKNRIYGLDHDHARPQEYCSVKWLSSKMRIMKKMTDLGKPSAVRNLGSDSKHKASIMIPPRAPDLLENKSSSSANITRSSVSGIDNSNNNKNNNPITIRVCANCSTTKTPLWRSGPTGPKSLCNACGIRQRKARQAMAAAVVAANGEVRPQPNPAPTKVKQKKKRLLSSDTDDDNGGSDPRPEKGPKTLLHLQVGSRDLRFEEFVMKLREWISDFQGVFPQDEKEAAILLMALSYSSVPG